MDTIDQRMFWCLPEVAHLVEKIPVVKYLLTANDVQLQFFRHAKESGMSIKQQLEIIGVPYAFRNFPEEFGNEEFFDSVNCLDARVQEDLAKLFSNGDLSTAVLAMERVSRLSLHTLSQRWFIRHFHDFGAEQSNVVTYLIDNPIKSLKTKPDNVIRKMREQRQRDQALASEDIIRSISALQSNDGAGTWRLFATDRWRRMHDQELMNHFYNDQIRAMDIAMVGRRLNQAPEVPIKNSADLPEHVLAQYSPGENYSIKLLNTLREFQEEGSFMNHCVADYFNPVARGELLIASITNSYDARIATVEYKRPSFEMGQIKSHSNLEVSDHEVLDLARSFGSHLREIWDNPPVEKPRQPSLPVVASSKNWTGV